MKGVALKGLQQLSMVHPRRNRLEAQAELNNWSKAWRRQAEPTSSGLQLLIACRELRLLFFRPS
ncbi:hypothetical protein PMIT1342_00166 [Prochlorococcus marinus str. MIT 1342]|uniref:hypothetical protein n=1 Tax=Prochlorococcus TaxID=1218 RepID=UPI0007B377E5|nr:hypothetical protein [Prochlorococcus marinus]KZR83848.1 hypothetical protein PMIT1342_00166 [Prochlorococcus marinus str. MIT 1342]